MSNDRGRGGERRMGEEMACTEEAGDEEDCGTHPGRMPRDFRGLELALYRAALSNRPSSSSSS